MSTSDPTTTPALGYAWAMIGTAFVGSLLGAMLPLLDVWHQRARQRRQSQSPSGAAAATPWLQRWLSAHTVNIQSNAFLSASMAASAGILLYATTALMLPTGRELLEPTLGRWTGMTLFGLWAAGIAVMFGIRLVEHHYREYAKRQQPSSTSASSPKPNLLPVNIDRVMVDYQEMSTLNTPTVPRRMELLTATGASPSSPETPLPPNETTKSSETEEHHQSTVTMEQAADDDDQDEHSLKSFSWMAAVAIGIHKLPEGILVFTSALSSPSFGALLAIAIMLHNIPESIAISLPLYVSTKNVWVACGVAVAVGAMQPLGALVGYALLSAGGFSPFAQGLLYAPIAGLMTYIVVRGLWPSAMVYDVKMAHQRKRRGAAGGKQRPYGAWAGTWFLVGTAVMFMSGAIYDATQSE